MNEEQDKVMMEMKAKALLFVGMILLAAGVYSGTIAGVMILWVFR